MTRLAHYLTVFSLILIIGTGCEPITQSNSESDTQLDAEALAKKGKKAGPNSVFALDFSDAADAADNTPTSPGWITDRYNPSLGYSPVEFSQSLFDGDERLQINISETGPTSGFYGYQGMKYLDAGEANWNAEANAKFSYRFYIDPSWETDGEGQQTGVWGVLGNTDGVISAYPILEYQDSDANEDGEAGFRAYTYFTDEDGNLAAEWVSIGIPKQLRINPDEGGWVTVEMQLHKTNGGAAVKWRINNKLVLDERGYNVFAPSTQFLNFIFNSANFGTDQNYYYDDIVLTEPGHAGR